MSAVVVCLNCGYYRKGGFCSKKQKDVGALHEACEEAKSETEVKIEEEAQKPLILTKKCRKCGQELPLSAFCYTTSNKGNKIRRRTCDECYTQSMSKNGKKKKVQTTIKIEKPMETIPTKRCSKCGEEKPLTDFGANRTAKDGKQRWCKACMNKATSRAMANRPKTKEASAEKKPTAPSTQIVVREVLTDAQMVEALRAHGWQVTCTRTVTEEL